MLQIYENLESLNHHLRMWGFAILHRGLNEDISKKLLREVKKHPMKKAKRDLYDNGIKQDFDYYDGQVSDYVQGFIDGLQTELNMIFRGCYEQEMIFDDVIIQRYTEAHAGIEPHRDPDSCKGLVVSICLSGEADFSIYYDSNKNTHTAPVSVGDISLLGARGFNKRSHTKRHSVQNIRGERYVLGLRQMAA